MFPSSNNGNDPIYYSDQQGYNRPSFNDITSNSKREDPLFSCFYPPFPFPPYDQLELQDHDVLLHQNHDLLLHHQPLFRAFASNTSTAASVETILDMDKLCFDKASKTVEWLLIQARPAIKKLSSGLPQFNYSSSVGTKSASTSECEVVSGIDDEAAAIKATTKISNAKTSSSMR
ncbi:hypothetical protein GH714_027986 [Hevea brasiliensis]|uniref:TCP domain-containing protein n=1 Tax=Hevea brasiliensis TaxID=3981 RepID=A0A6A6LBK2_HEVBR|nr:hypothetical protein GH714_027986 [Hevea brasiliensis]